MGMTEGPARVRIVIDLKRDATDEVVLNQLWRHTPAQTSFPANMLAIRGGRPELLGLRDALHGAGRHVGVRGTRRRLQPEQTPARRFDPTEGAGNPGPPLEPIVLTDFRQGPRLKPCRSDQACRDGVGVAAELGMAGTFSNSLDAVSDRDFVVDFHSAAALAMVHLSRLSEEIILWSTAEFGLARLDDAFSTGSTT
mgnify:CR=1 FL=1